MPRERGGLSCRSLQQTASSSGSRVGADIHSPNMLNVSAQGELRPWSDMHNRKDLQLCRQVFDALTYALAELDDPIIDELVLASVVPAPSAARLQVTLVPSHEDIDPDDALARVRDVADELREEVAAEVTRKRAPELVFRIGRRDELQT
jgi:ribosome-binding factor A